MAPPYRQTRNWSVPHVRSRNFCKQPLLQRPFSIRAKSLYRSRPVWRWIRLCRHSAGTLEFVVTRQWNGYPFDGDNAVRSKFHTWPRSGSSDTNWDIHDHCSDFFKRISNPARQAGAGKQPLHRPSGCCLAGIQFTPKSGEQHAEQRGQFPAHECWKPLHQRIEANEKISGTVLKYSPTSADRSLSFGIKGEVCGRGAGHDSNDGFSFA